MLEKMVRLVGDNGRWLELAVGVRRAEARTGGGEEINEEFPFSYENLTFVLEGLGYQAWGGGSHFAIRQTPEGFAVEFQGPRDRSPSTAMITRYELAEKIRSLNVAEARMRATVL